MLTKIFNKLRGRTTIGPISVTDPKRFAYTVTLPNQEPVVLRAKNQVEVKAMVRDAQGLTRLPSGTTVERLG